MGSITVLIIVVTCLPYKNPLRFWLPRGRSYMGAYIRGHGSFFLRGNIWFFPFGEWCKNTINARNQQSRNGQPVIILHFRGEKRRETEITKKKIWRNYRESWNLKQNCEKIQYLWEMVVMLFTCNETFSANRQLKILTKSKISSAGVCYVIFILK